MSRVAVITRKLVEHRREEVDRGGDRRPGEVLFGSELAGDPVDLEREAGQLGGEACGVWLVDISRGRAAH
jgi:hypothetical protein